MSNIKANSPGVLVQYHNCRILYHGKIIKEDFWVRDGKIMNPEKVFYLEKIKADFKFDCGNHIIAPGFIDVQINGGFGYDFSSNVGKLSEGLEVVAKGILQHGVTSFCPTLVTSPVNIYRQALPKMKAKRGGKHGAQLIGAHCEGPFISKEKKGAHDIDHIKSEISSGFETLRETYGTFTDISIITIAPELSGIIDCIPQLKEKNIVVSIGHCVANLSNGEDACKKGATFITHLFNAMLPFHHRDPGIVGLLTSLVTPTPVFYGMITDGIHTHPTALRIAQRSHPDGIVLVTDAIAALGLPPGLHKLGTMDIIIDESTARISGTETLAGSICSMDSCVRHFKEDAGISSVTALEAATLHPAQLLSITHEKGTLEYDTDADFIFLTDSLHVKATFIAGELVWTDSSEISKFYEYFE